MSRASQWNALLIQHCYIPYGTTQLKKKIKNKQKGPFWGPRRYSEGNGLPEGARYQVKVCGEHESNPGGPIRQLEPNLVSRGPPRAPKGAFWAKTGPFRAPVGPEGVRYQVKVCGDHEFNPEELIGGSWDQIWPPGALRGPPGPPKGSFGAETSPFGGPRSTVEVP